MFLLTLVKFVILNIPISAWITYIWITGNFLLFETPFWQLFSAGSQCTILQIMNKHQLAADRWNCFVFAATRNHNFPNVICVTDSVLWIAYRKCRNSLNFQKKEFSCRKNDELKCLLSYSKQLYPQGQRLYIFIHNTFYANNSDLHGNYW